MKKFYLFLLAIAVWTNTQAQGVEEPKKLKAFNHLDVSFTAGTTGLGFDVAAPIGDYVQLRTGFDWMPRWEKEMSFDIQSFSNDGKISSLTEKFDRISKLMYEVTGYRVDSNIDMIGKPTYWNFKFLVDVFPFRNKHWHFTAGFYWGPSKIAEAVNATHDSPSLFALGMYNHIYEGVDQTYNHGNPTPFITYDGREIYLDPMIEQKVLQLGRLGIHVGDYVNDMYDADGNLIHKAGDPYRMEPDENSMVWANAYVNSFKPYLGFGYGGRLIKGNDNYHISFDCGLLLWGGTPDCITHDGTNLTKDVNNISGKVGDYVDLMSNFKVFPVLNLRLTRRIF